MAAQNLGRVRLHPSGFPRWPGGGASRARACLPSSPAPGGNRAAVKTRAQGVSCGLFSAGSHSQEGAGERMSPCWSLLGSLSDKPAEAAKRGPEAVAVHIWWWGR